MPRLRLVLVPAAAAIAVAIGAAAVQAQLRADDPTAYRSMVAASTRVDRHLEKRRPAPTTTAPTTTLAPPPPVTSPPTTAAPHVHLRAASTNAPPAPAPAPPATAAPVSAPDAESRALQLVNDERARAGLPALQRSGGASSVARSWATAMANRGLAHNPNLSRDLQQAGVTGWRTIGENVGNGGTIDGIHARFMSSGGHRDNILSSAYSSVGIGVVSSGGLLWLTMDFVGY